MDNRQGRDVLLTVEDGIAMILLNRPQRRNALSVAMLAELRRCMRECEARDDVSVTILSGADPAFCAGIDLREAASETDITLLTAPRGERDRPFPDREKLLIGAINGPAVTGGLELALACDFLVASERASFADTHARVGVQPGWGLTVLLSESVGVRRAREMSATGNFVDAPTALAWGLVNHITPHEELLPYTRRLAADVASSDVDGVRTILATYAAGVMTTPGAHWDLAAATAAQWQSRGGGAPGEIDRRRDGVIRRGRGETSR